jgi:acid stress-induced BolA-like protein IbaG/YrbA
MSIANENVEKLIKESLPDAEVSVAGDGYKYEATIISDAFSDLNTLKRHQLVYAALNDVIAGGELHALTLKTFTPEEAQ